MRSRVVFKYPIPDWGKVILLSDEDNVVHVGEQDGVVTLWVEHVLNVPQVGRIFEVMVTGEQFAYPVASHVGSVQMPTGLVWHVYYVGDA